MGWDAAESIMSVSAISLPHTYAGDIVGHLVAGAVALHSLIPVRDDPSVALAVHVAFVLVAVCHSVALLLFDDIKIADISRLVKWFLPGQVARFSPEFKRGVDESEVMKMAQHG
jgi:hypothetical protein